MRNGGPRKDALIVISYLFLSILFFWSVTVGGKTLLPADNVFDWEPWKSYAHEVGVHVPHNALLSDLYLENYVWKRFILNSLHAGRLPLWNPYILAGVPFLAAGQHSAMYPLTILFYVLPIPVAYGWFAAMHLFLAGTFTYVLARALRIGRGGSSIAGITFMFSGYMVIRNVFPMVVAASVWLPLILAVIARVAGRAEEGRARPASYILDLLLGAVAFGMAFLAGHPEMYYYVSLTSALFVLWRLARMGLLTRRWWVMLRTGIALLGMVLLGAGLGSAQWLPLLEVARHNFREGAASFQEMLSWAYPPRRVLSLFMPDFFGNPTHHAYFDLFSWEWVPVTVNALGQPIDTIYWGVKNYVEGASYVGLLPTLLAFVAILRRKGRNIWFFAFLAAMSLAFVFGSPLYVLVYKLPGLSQVHSPFRWIYPYSLCMAVLAGMGLDVLCRGPRARETRTWWSRAATTLTEMILPRAALLGGLIALGGLAVCLALREHMGSLSQRAMDEWALAPYAYADWRMLYSYEFRNLLIFGATLLLSGGVLSLGSRLRRAAAWTTLMAAVILAELFFIGRSFFPAVDPALVGYRPPAVDFLKSDPELYRITSYVSAGERTFNANAGMFYDISDVRGYDSIIPRQYADYMGIIQYQSDLLYNRIAPIYDHHAWALDSPLLDMLNVKYVLTSSERDIDRRGYSLVYDREIRIYRNDDYMPRVFLVPKAINIPDPKERRRALRVLNPREVVILEEDWRQELAECVPAEFSHRVEGVCHTPDEVTITVDTPIPCFVVLADTFFSGWQANMRALDAEHANLAEQGLHIYRANGNFRAVEVPAGRYVVRFVYSPGTVKVGFSVSAISGIALLVALGVWAWWRSHRESEDEIAG